MLDVACGEPCNLLTAACHIAAAIKHHPCPVPPHTPGEVPWNSKRSFRPAGSRQASKQASTGGVLSIGCTPHPKACNSQSFLRPAVWLNQLQQHLSLLGATVQCCHCQSGLQMESWFSLGGMQLRRLHSTANLRKPVSKPHPDS